MKQRRTILVKGWHVELLRVLEVPTLEEKAALLARFSKPAKATALAGAYFEVLSAAGAIRSKLDFINNGMHQQDDLSTINQIAREGFLKSVNAADKIVVLFFPLQLYCYRLVQILNSAQGTQAGLTERSNKGGAGGKALNRGKEKLWSLYVQFFDSLSVEAKYKTVEKLVEAHNVDITKILTDLQHRPGADENGRRFTFGAAIVPGNLPKRLKAWEKEFPPLKESLDKLVLRSK